MKTKAELLRRGRLLRGLGAVMAAFALGGAIVLLWSPFPMFAALWAACALACFGLAVRNNRLLNEIERMP